MTATVGDMIRILEQIAPAGFAEDWDNPGLQVGCSDWPVAKVWTALDPLPEVVSAACAEGVDLLVTHHPLLFRPLARIDFKTPVGRVLEQALTKRLSVVAAHTNLDSVPGGLNDILAERIGLTSLTGLSRSGLDGHFKLVVFVPQEAEEKVMLALSRTPAGRIGRYAGCSFRSPGTGSFTAEVGARPRRGAVGETTSVNEVRIETRLREKDIAEVIQCLRQVHPYEQMAYDLYRLADDAGRLGIGRVGRLSTPRRLCDLAGDIGEALGLKSVQMAGNPDLEVRKVALCTGSGSSLMKDFLASGAEVYVSGDLKYHDARDAQTAGRGLIDLGHFGSEHFMVQALSQRLKKMLDDEGLAVDVESCPFEEDPFKRIQAVQSKVKRIHTLTSIDPSAGVVLWHRLQKSRSTF